jgi:hypothetical protein
MGFLTLCDEISKFVTHVTSQHEFQLSSHPTNDQFLKKKLKKLTMPSPCCPHP